MDKEFKCEDCQNTLSSDFCQKHTFKSATDMHNVIVLTPSKAQAKKVYPKKCVNFGNNKFTTKQIKQKIQLNRLKINKIPLQYTINSLKYPKSHISYVSQESGVTCQVSHVTCHVSHFFFFFLLLLFLIGGASRWRICYQRSLPRLIY